MPKIITQKNTKWEILISPLFESMHFFAGKTLVLRLQNRGFSKEEISEIDSYFLIFDLLISFVYGNMKISKNLWKYYKITNTTSLIAVKTIF